SSSVVNQLHRQFTHWKRSSPSDYNSFLNLVVHLIAKCKVGSCDIINFLLRTALPQEESAGSELPVDEVRDTCIEIMLGLMSSKYAAKRGVQHVTSLNEVLQMWMACPPAKMLMEITTECFAAMVGSAPDICVDALLEASVRYSPHFDWVVAHIGSCFPRTIITRVLNCGLKDYCTGSVDGSDKDASSSRMKVPKMASVVGILGHLAAKHSQDIRKALMALFEASLHSDTQSSRVTTLPFLLQLASMSDLLLNILTPDLVSVCKSLSFIIVNLKKYNRRLQALHILLFELQRGVLARKGNAVVVDLPLLSGLAEQSSKLTTLLLQSYGKRVPWLQKLLTYTSLQAGENCSASMLANIVFSANTPQQELTQFSDLSFSTILEGLKQRHSVLCDLLLSANEDISMCALRLMTLVGFPDDLSISLLTRLCSVIAIIFFTSLHKNTEQKDNASKADRMTQLCMSCIEQLSRYPFTKSLFIHYLLEGAVQKENCHLFGGRWQPATSNSPHGNGVDTVSLLEENRQQSLSIALPRFHSSVYHGGIIRQIPKTQLPVKPLQKSQVVRNCLIFTETLWLCCRENRQRHRQDLSGQVNSDTGHEPMETDQVNRHMTAISESSARTLGCVIVDILTLDTLYNDVHWQDPDFRKVTTERDTLVWKRLEDLPVVWNVIQEFSSSCVFVYYLSPVLRSLMAVIMNHLEVSRDTRMRNCPKQFEGAIKLVHCLTKGSMIPPPLSNVAELFPFVSPYEGYLLLLTLWRYIKENPPTEFEKEQSSRTCDTSHMFVVHSILHANINHMGHLCPRFFNM
uniref:Integrator complex subunit 5 C-terminal domain-containing protein n=1 Tax=Biomphalaria glabrata TaxID=6526 RepID=A0A2C9LHY6_BIOGL